MAGNILFWKLDSVGAVCEWHYKESTFMCYVYYAAQGVFNFYSVTERFFTVTIRMKAIMQ